MAKIMLEETHFSILAAEDAEGVVQTYLLVFTEHKTLAPGLAPVAMDQVSIQFSAEGWENFKRHIEADGNVPAIELAKELPKMVMPTGAR